MKEMNASKLVYIAFYSLLAAKFGQSIHCYSCDPYETDAANSSNFCETHSRVKDCSEHPEFGEHYDSCFTQVIYNHGKTIAKVKECAISSGCEELEQILCTDIVDGSGKPSPQNCWVDCCQDDFCNTDPVDSPGYVKRRQAERSEVAHVRSRGNCVLKSATFGPVVTIAFVAFLNALIPW